MTPHVSRSVPFTPARLWRAFFLATCLTPLAWAGPPSKSTPVSPTFVQFGEPDQAKGAEILREFRGLGIAGDYYLEFDLSFLPRRGDAVVYRGRLWGSRNADGPVSRVVLEDGIGGVRKLLIQNGPTPVVWLWEEGMTAAKLLPESEVYAPLLPGAELTPFDLLMPYFYWDDFIFEGVSKVLGRAAHTFLVRVPVGDPADGGKLAGVRVQLDTQFRAMVQSELIGQDGEPYKSLTLRDLKKVSDQWMIKVVDLRNEVTRDKTRFEVRRAALNLDLSPRVFAPEALNESIATPTETVALGR